MRRRPQTFSHGASQVMGGVQALRTARRLVGLAKPDDALAMAVRLYRSPGLARTIRRSELPEGVIFVIRVAADCPVSGPKAAELTGLDLETVTRIASLYLLVALFDQEGDAYRTLGLAPGAAPELLQDHRKWLLKWLHPDRNRNQALAGLSVRVLAASAELAGTPAAEPGPRPAEPVANAEASEPRSRRQWRRRWVPVALEN